MEILATLGALLVSAIAFLVGKSLGESEKILNEKRRVYEEFLRIAPKPNEVFGANGDDFVASAKVDVANLLPVVLFYGGQSVLKAAAIYIEVFSKAANELSPTSPPTHPDYQAAAKAHNDLILEMRRDAFALSAFAYHGKSRLPK